MLHLLKSLGFFAIYLLSLTSANAPEPLFKAKGDDFVLDPNYSGPPITSIEWKHGSDIAAEWYGGDAECLRQFKGRCTLDPSIGTLTIKGLTGKESGLYTVTINEKKTDTKILLSVISKVPKPTISSQCDTDTTSCTLTCDGNTTDAGLVSCTWFAGDAVRGSDKVLKITEETKDESFTCKLQNQVSNQTSDSFPNPLTKDKTNLVAIILPIVLSLALIGCIVGFVIYKKKNGRSFNLDWVRKRAKQGTKEENAVELLNGDAVLQQPKTTLDIVSEVQVETIKGSAPAVTQNSDRSDSEAQRGPIQVQAHVEPQNAASISAEETPLMAEISDQDTARAETPGISEETGNTSRTGETPPLDQTVPESLNTSEETENSALMSKHHESTNPESANHENYKSTNQQNHESTNHQNHKSTNPENCDLTNHEPALVEEEADGEGDGD